MTKTSWRTETRWATITSVFPVSSATLNYLAKAAYGRHSFDLVLPVSHFFSFPSLVGILHSLCFEEPK